MDQRATDKPPEPKCGNCKHWAFDEFIVSGKCCNEKQIYSLTQDDDYCFYHEPTTEPKLT